MNLKFVIITLGLTTILFLSYLHAVTRNENTSSQPIISHFKNLSKSTPWELVAEVKQNFHTYHPQGMVKIGEFIYLSSVENIIKPEKLDPPQNGMDRTPGTGTGHLFKVDLNGNLLEQITLGNGTMYHPGGIDYDGTYIWCPVAEYRPNSETIIYRIHPDSLTAHEMFRFNDHIGAVVYNRKNHTLHGMSWGSRRFYVWNTNDIARSNQIPEFEMTLNGNHYIDYQDCHYVEENYAFCSGLSHYKVPGAGKISLGGIELLDLKNQVAIHQIPVQFWVNPDLVLTNNPFYVEVVDNHLRFYFMPEDDNSTLYIYEVNH